MATINKKCSQCIYNDNCIEHPDDCPSFIDRDSVAYAYTPERQDTFYGNNTLEFGVGVEHKSRLTVGNLVIYNTHHFNWLERKMWKLLLGFDIENVKEEY
jgi:hypothetical protein